MTQKFVQEFEKKVKDTIKKYKLIDKDEKVIVAHSGGKDSTTLLYLLKKFGYNVEALTVDLKIGEWSKTNIANSKKICEQLGVKQNIVDVKKYLGKSVKDVKEDKNKARAMRCFVCSITKRYLLNKMARDLGANKLAMGHNLDDEAESVIMNFFRGNIEIGLRTGPKIGLITDKKFAQRIRPLFFLTNKEIKKYSQIKKFSLIYDPCPFSTFAYRRTVRGWLSKIEEKNPALKENIVKWFMKRLPELRKNIKATGKLSYCKICGEPTKRDICKFCEVKKKIIS